MWADALQARGEPLGELIATCMRAEQVAAIEDQAGRAVQTQGAVVSGLMRASSSR